MKVYFGGDKVIIRYIMNIIKIMLLLLLTSQISSAIDGDEKQHKYIGAAKCKMCHKKEKKGLQYEIWQSSAHSKAYELLGTPEAMEVAKKRGIENPQEDANCLRCHTAGYDAPSELRGRKFDITEGVGCEACHGAGGDYYKSKVMKGLRAGRIEYADVGLVKPDESTCRQCHNSDSPTPKEFVFKEMWAKIAHPIP